MTQAPWPLSTSFSTAEGAFMLNMQLALALQQAGYQVSVGGHVVAGELHGVKAVPEAELQLLQRWAGGPRLQPWTDLPAPPRASPATHTRVRRAARHRDSGKSGAKRPAFDHVIISQHLAQYTLRLPMVAAVGTYLWLHEVHPSGQVWAWPPDGEVNNGSVAMYVTNRSYSTITWSPSVTRQNTPEADARPPSLHLLANMLPRLDRVLVRSPWHAQELAEQLALHGQPSSAAHHGRLIEAMPMAYDGAEWERARAAFGGDGGKKVKGRFLFCSVPQHSKMQHGLRTVLAIFPVMRKQIPSASLVVVATEQLSLPQDLRRDLQARHSPRPPPSILCDLARSPTARGAAGCRRRG